MTGDLASYERILASFPQPKFADLPNGPRLAYREWGDPTAPPLILIHGITSCSLSWVRVAERLAGTYRVIVTDNRGHGDSAAPHTGYRFEDQAEDTARLMAALHIQSARVIGHSWGGAIAVSLATGPHAARVQRLILEDPLVGLSAERAATIADGYVAQVGLTRAEALAKLPTVVKPEWTAADAAGKLDAMQKGHQHAVQAVFTENSGTDLVPRYAQLRCPILMVLAPADLGGIVPAARLAEIRRTAPNVRIVTVAGADHNVHRTRFDQFMDTIEPFLAGA